MPAVTKEEVYAKVRELLVDLTVPDSVQPQAKLGDLGLDSLDSIDLAIELECHFDINIPDGMEETSGDKTVQELVDWLYEQARDK